MFDNLGLSPQQQAIAEKIAAAGFAAGMTEAGVAAMVTHAIHESGLNPTLSHPDAPPGSKQQFNSNGLFQMNRDRWDDLVEYAAANGLDPWSADAQIGYQIHEMTNPPQPGLSNYQKIAEPLFYSNDPKVTSQAFSKIEGHQKVINGFDEVAERVADTSKLYAGSYNDLAGFKTQVAGPPVSAQAVDAPMPSLTPASMGGLPGPIVSEDTAIPGSSFFSQIGQAALAQTGQPFGAINFGSPSSFRGPSISYDGLGAPVSPTLFDGTPDALAYGLPDIPQDTPAPAPAPASAQLPGLGGMPPAGSFGAMPLGNYQMASIAQPPAPTPQPSANVSISALAGPVPSLSMSGRAMPSAPAASAAIAPQDEQALTPAGYSPASAPAPSSLPTSGDPMAVLSGLPSAAELAKSLPAPPSSGTTTTAITPSGAPTATPTPGVGGFANLDAPTSAPTISTITPNITTAPPSTPAPGVSFGSIPAAGGIPGASLGIDMSSVATPPSTPAAAPSAGWQASPLPAFGTPAAPPVQAPAAPPSSPAIAPPDDYALPSPQGAPSSPALGIPGASAAVDIQQGLASLPAPTALPETPPPAAPAAPHPGTQWSGLGNMNTPPSFGSLPTVGADLLDPNPIKQEAIPTVKAPDAPPTQVAGPGVPIGGLPATPPIGAAAPAAAAAVRAASPPAPAAPVTGPVVAPQQQPQQAPSFGALPAPQAPAAPAPYNMAGPTYNAGYGYGVMPTGQWGWNTTTATPASFGGYGSFANISDWTPAGYEFGPTEQQIAATGSGAFGALADAFGFGGQDYDYGGIY